MDEFGMSQIGLIVITALIPLVGFAMTIIQSRKGTSRREQRWRKRHGLLFWVLLPTIFGMMTLLGYLRILPDLYGLIGVIALGGTTFLSWSINERHEEFR